MKSYRCYRMRTRCLWPARLRRFGRSRPTWTCRSWPNTWAGIGAVRGLYRCETILSSTDCFTSQSTSHAHYGHPSLMRFTFRVQRRQSGRAPPAHASRSRERRALPTSTRPDGSRASASTKWPFARSALRMAPVTRGTGPRFRSISAPLLFDRSLMDLLTAHAAAASTCSMRTVSRQRRVYPSLRRSDFVKPIASRTGRMRRPRSAKVFAVRRFLLSNRLFAQPADIFPA